MDEVQADFPAVFALIARRLRMIISILIATTVLAAIALLLMPERYEATTLIYVETLRPDLLDPELARPASTSDNVRVDSEVEIIGSDAVLLEAIAALDLINDPEFGPHPALADRLLSLIPGFEEHQLASPFQETLANLKAATSIKRRGLPMLFLFPYTPASQVVLHLSPTQLPKPISPPSLTPKSKRRPQLEKSLLHS